MCTIIRTCVYAFIELGPATKDDIDQVIAFCHPSAVGVSVRVVNPSVAETTWKISAACQIGLLSRWLLVSILFST